MAGGTTISLYDTINAHLCLSRDISNGLKADVNAIDAPLNAVHPDHGVLLARRARSGRSCSDRLTHAKVYFASCDYTRVDTQIDFGCVESRLVWRDNGGRLVIRLSNLGTARSVETSLGIMLRTQPV